MIIIGIIVSILLFSIIVLIHELGHFSASRIFGVKVEEFGLGIPPRAKKLFTDKKGTLYSLNWLPLGGFVRLKGENSALLKNKNDKDALINKPIWKQSIIILAGVFMNFLLAGIIFSILFMIGIKPIGINTKIETNLELKLIPNYEKSIDIGLLIKNDGIILSPTKGSIAEQSGIKNGDIVYQIYKDCNKYESELCKNGQSHFLIQNINNSDDLIDIFQNNKNEEIILYLNKNLKTDAGGKFLNIKLNETGKIGAYIGENIELNQDFEYKYSFLESIKYGFLETYNQSLLTFSGLKILLKNIFFPETQEERTEAINNVSGPIGIVEFISSSIGQGFIFILIIGAIISINLGVFNLLPIPALDGGRFLIIIINSITSLILGKKSINENIEGIIHLVFFMILIALSLIIAYNDIHKIIIN